MMDAPSNMVASTCTGKVVFASRSVALLGISKRNKGLVQPYHCDVCHNWHVGSIVHTRGRKLQRKKLLQKRERT